MEINALTGPIPSELGELSQLTSLWMSRNRLTGTIPPEIGQLINLEGTWFFSNDLNGTMPQAVCDNIDSPPRVDCENVTCSCCTDPNGVPC